MDNEELLEAPVNRRMAAGENPAKRDQILDGAQKIFMENGFEGTSMNDVTRAAGVSKGTVYVYFSSKEDLFTALVERERERMAAMVRTTLDESLPLEDALFNFGTTIATFMTTPRVIRGMRMAIGVVGKLPETADCFLRQGVGRGPQILQVYLDKQVAKGALNIDDTLLAARQFGELCLAGLFRPALFGEAKNEPSREQIEHTVRIGIDMFMNYYARKP